MKKKRFGRGNTITGLRFERGRDILSILSNAKGYSVKGNVIYYLGMRHCTLLQEILYL